MAITIKSNTLKNETMNIRGVNLYFDSTGICKTATKALAVLIAPMAGFSITGMDDETQEVADDRKKQIEEEKNTQEPGFARGIPRAAHSAQPQGFVTNPDGGRMMGAVQDATGETATKSEAVSEQEDGGKEEASGDEEEASAEEETSGEAPETAEEVPPVEGKTPESKKSSIFDKAPKKKSKKNGKKE